MSFTHQIAASLTALALSCTALAGPKPKAHGDILIGIDAGQLVTSLIAEDKSFVVPGVRVFGVELGRAGVPFFTDEPGWQALDGTFDPFTLLGFDLTAELRRWNGDGFDSLNPLIDETMTLSFAGGALSAITGSGLVHGFSLTTDDEGGLHDHLDHTLNGPAGFDPRDGVYLLELRFTTSMTAIAHSEPVWIVFNNGLNERDHDAAIEWVEGHLIPAPSGLALLVAHIVTVRRRRQRDRATWPAVPPRARA